MTQGPWRSDLDLDRREIRVRGKGGRERIVRIVMRPPAASTGTCGSGPGTRWPRPELWLGTGAAGR